MAIMYRGIVVMRAMSAFKVCKMRCKKSWELEFGLFPIGKYEIVAIKIHMLH